MTSSSSSFSQPLRGDNPTIASLTQANLKLQSELRRVKDELMTVKAIQCMEDSHEVERIKTAYQELEAEVVALRKERLETFSKIVDYTDDLCFLEPSAISSDNSNNNEMIELLSEQLQTEKAKYDVLQVKYNELRQDLLTSPTEGAKVMSVAYSDISTCAASSPSYLFPDPSLKAQKFSVETFRSLELKPQLEEMFKKTSSGRRTVPLLVPIAPQTSASASVSTTTTAAAATVPPVVKRSSTRADPSIQRLAKIARFKQQ